MSTSGSRGQAAVEFALGSLVFVTVLMFGIHFAEVGYLGAKVHEAGAAAMWDATAYRSYSYGPVFGGGWYDSDLNAVPGANAASARYQDWDGRTNGGVGGTGPQMVLTKAQPLTILCSKNGNYALPPYAPLFGEPGGVSCVAEGDIDFGPMRMPNKMAEGANGFFKEKHNSRIGSPTKMCGMGRATGGICNGSMSVLLGDDALTEINNQNQECVLDTASGGMRNCGNPMYYAMNRQTWDQSMQLSAGWGNGYTGAPEAWAQNASSDIPPGQITGFYTSFRGEESFFLEGTVSGNSGGVWQTSPMDATMTSGRPYRSAYQSRGTCAGRANANSGWAPGGYCYLGKFPCGS